MRRQIQLQLIRRIRRPRNLHIRPLGRNARVRGFQDRMHAGRFNHDGGAASAADFSHCSREVGDSRRVEAVRCAEGGDGGVDSRLDPVDGDDLGAGGDFGALDEYNQSRT